MLPDAVIIAIKDERRCLHAPMDDTGDLAACGVTGVRVEYPASHAAIWCSTCMHDAVNSKGARLWPVVISPNH